jgi:AmmeMemoRadiSam system protein A
MSVSEADQKRLLKLARDSIQAHLKGEGPPPPGETSPLLCEPRGVFVSLHRQGRLRGCIGYLEAIKPLGEAVVEMAAAAAFHDPRFQPLRKEELAGLDVEISVLTPMERLENVENIEVGKHGLYIEKGGRRGLLLPQVAVDCRWDRLTFLAQTCVKAGLPPLAWKDEDALIYTFTADIFSDHPEQPRHPK